MASKMLKVLGFSSLVLLTAACSQTPAKVVMKGNQYYGMGEMPQNVRMAMAQPSAPVVSARPAPKPTYRAPSPAPVQMASRQAPQPAIGFKPSASTTQVRQAQPVQLAEIEVKELAPPPAAPSSAAAPVSTSVESAPASLEIAAKQPTEIAKPALLPEPQAPAMEESAAPAKVVVSSSGFIWPVKGEVIARFGAKTDGEYNDGINIAAREGEAIVASADGEVVYSGNALPGYGNMVILRHEGNIMTAYAHAGKILVNKGDKVQQGIAIATVGRTGRVTTPQVHFGVRKDKEPMDPMAYLGSQNYAAR